MMNASTVKAAFLGSLLIQISLPAFSMASETNQTPTTLAPSSTTTLPVKEVTGPAMSAAPTSVNVEQKPVTPQPTVSSPAEQKPVASQPKANSPMEQKPLTSAPVLPGVVPQEFECKDGVRLPMFETEMKKVFPTATTVKQVDFLPLNNGGTSFTGLVSRLLGTGLNQDLEGMKTRRYYYVALENANPIGIAHGSSEQAMGNMIHIFTYYTPGGTIKDVQVQNIAEPILKDLVNGGYLKQFVGHNTEEFEVTLGKKGRIKSRGAMFKSLRYPPGAVARNYFEKIFRSLRFNCAFMDVAYFITQHPDAADHPTQEFPDGVTVTTGKPVHGPEAFVQDKALGSPIDGKPITQSPETKK